MQNSNAAQITRTFFDAYLVRRDVDDTLACLTESVQWGAMGKSELIDGRVQAEQALCAEFASAPESCRVEYEHIEETLITDGCAAVRLTASVYPPSKGAGTIRLTAYTVCIEDGDGMSLSMAWHREAERMKRICFRQIPWASVRWNTIWV